MSYWGVVASIFVTGVVTMTMGMAHRSFPGMFAKCSTNRLLQAGGGKVSI